MSESPVPPAGPSNRPKPMSARRPSAEAVSAPTANSPREPLIERLISEAKSVGPGFAASLAFHLFLLFVFALVVVSQEHSDDLAAVLGGFNRVDPTRGPKASPVPIEIEALKVDDTNPKAGKRSRKKAEPPADDPSAGVVKPQEVNVAGALGGRTPEARAEIIESQGGSEKTEQSVTLGLSWLVRMQKGDGHWELHQGYPDPGQLRTNTGATALALMSFLGSGNTPQEGPHRERVAKGIKWLVAQQKKDGPLKGDFYDFEREGDPASFYAHGQATIALCEAYALTRDATLLPHIRDALAFLYAAQHPQTGGWKYRRRSEGDLSVFGWQIMALQSARMAGIEVPSDVLERAAHFLDLVQDQGGARYRYEPIPDKSPTPAMTAEGLLCRQYLGWPRNHPAMRAGVEYLLQPENLPSWSAGRRNVYFWYYATQVLHNLQGHQWQVWNKALRDELVRNQVKGGAKTGGSWNPVKPAGSIDENTDKGGRLYVTCLCLLTLEAYYRHIPLYRELPQ